MPNTPIINLDQPPVREGNVHVAPLSGNQIEIVIANETGGRVAPRIWDLTADEARNLLVALARVI